jgi:hypothetical protein
MKPLFYLLRRSIVNHIKQLRHKPGTLVVFIAMIVFFAFVLISSFFAPANNRTASPDIYGIAVSVVILMFVYFSISRGIKQGSSFYRMADVNLVFTAPISPKRVLFYGFIKQIGITLLSVIFVIWQIPNLRNNYEITNGGIAILLAGFFFLLLQLQVIGMLIYSWTSRTKKARQTAERIWNALGAVVALLVVAKVMRTGSFREAADGILNTRAFEFVPVIGWFKTVLMAPITGWSSAFYTAVALIALSSAVLAVIFAMQQTDYYEDVLAFTEYRENLLAAKKEGKVRLNQLSSFKLRKARQRYGGTGARAIFYRHLLEYKKTGFFFLSRSTLVLAAAGFLAHYALPAGQITTLLAVSAYYLLIFGQFTGKWVAEIDRPYIYMIPAGSAAKLFNATLAELCKHLVDGIVLFGVAAISMRVNPLTAALCAIGYTTIAMMFTYSDVLYRRLFGALHSKVFQVFMGIVMLLVIIVPGIFLAFLMKYLVFRGTGDTSDIVFCLTLIAFNGLVASSIFAGSKGIFDRLEMK